MSLVHVKKNQEHSGYQCSVGFHMHWHETIELWPIHSNYEGYELTIQPMYKIDKTSLDRDLDHQNQHPWPRPLYPDGLPMAAWAGFMTSPIDLLSPCQASMQNWFFTFCSCDLDWEGCCWLLVDNWYNVSSRTCVQYWGRKKSTT